MNHNFKFCADPVEPEPQPSHSLFTAMCATVAGKQNQEVNDFVYQQKNPVVQAS